MRDKFKLIGLSKPRSMTCSVIGGSQEIFHPTIDISKDDFESLWRFYSMRRNDECFLAIIEHDGLNEDGTPINGVYIKLEIKQQIFNK